MSARAAIRVHLKEYSTLVRQLVESVVHVGTRPDAAGATPEAIIEQIIRREALLQKAVKELEEQQGFHQKLQHMKKEISQKDQVIVDLAFQLRQAEKLLDGVISEAKVKIQAMDQCNQANQVDPAELVQYAQRLSYTTSAPPRWVPGLPLFMFRPPAPQEDQMRSGILYEQLGLAAPVPAGGELTAPAADSELPPQVAQWKHEVLARPQGDTIPAPVNPLAADGIDIDLDLNPDLTAAEDDADVEWET